MEFNADSFLIPALRGAVEGLVSRAAHQMTLGWGFDGDLRKLHDNLTEIQGMFRDPRIYGWLEDIMSGISHAEKVLDELEYEALRREIEVRNRMWNKVHDFFSLSNPLAFRLKVVRRLKHINLQLERIYCLSWFRSGGWIIDEEFSRTIYVDGSKIVGRDRDVSTVRDMLLGSSEDDLSVVAIVGKGGVGKTTLARIIYNDETVRPYFESKFWIAGRLLNEMIETLTRHRSETANIGDTKVRTLQEVLKLRKYLLVLDDVGDTNHDKWLVMKDFLLQIGGSTGSKILVTTRSVDVVTAMQISPPLTHMLDCLSDDDSWTIFRKVAFADGGPRESQYLVEIGKRIVKKCEGLPFAIMLAGKALLSKHDASGWMSVYYRLLQSPVPTESDLKLLRQKFVGLPSLSLKKCFAYCAVFPNGSNIKKDELIQLWMSLGYLHPPLESNSESNSEMEDLGDEYYETLVQSSFLENGEMDDYKNITSCKMNDLVYDFAVDLYKSYCHTLEPSKRKYHTVVEHMSFDFWEEKRIDIPRGHVEMLTALFSEISVEVNRTLAFGLFGDDVEKLPNSVRKFKRLQYLDLSETSIKNYQVLLPSCTICIH